MLDIRKLRENPEAVIARLSDRNAAAAAAATAVLETDKRWREELLKVEALKADKNRLAKEVGARKAKKENADDLLAQSKEVAAAIDACEKGCKALEEEQQSQLLFIPNPPHPSVPVGSSAEENPVVHTWGEKWNYSFVPKTHIELCDASGLVDFEGARKISGSGFAVFKGQGARLVRALISFLLDRHTSLNGYTEVWPPVLIAPHSMQGTGQLPKFEEDLYGMGEGAERLYLAPTAEVPVTNLHRDEILKSEQLPICYAAYTPCFRKEAGSSGAQTRGLIRMHQFDKVELVKIVRPETSYDELEKLRRNAEEILEVLGLHYRTVLLCTGDMGFGAAKCYDLEVWAPGEGRYLEVSSCSNFEDFQARRMAVRYKTDDGKNVFCHTLNGSGTALPRLIIALLETYQQEDGTIAWPEVLKPYLGL